ncbi:MAG TPA: polysaccharide biosynthesis tyrosine autokinase [Actinopolymorphaceae bacterium]|jgi:capsular exopolysaccharide synthesis family protein
MRLRDYVAILRKRWLLIGVIALVALTAAAGLSFTATPTYQATASVYFSLPYGTTANDLYQGSNYTQNQVLSFAELATMPVVLQPAIDELGLQTSPKQLAGFIDATATANTVIVEITASDTSAQRSAVVANAVADELGIVVRKLSPKDTKGRSTVDVSTIGSASVPISPSAPKKKRNLVAGLFGGIFIGAALAVVMELLDTRIRRASDVAAITSAPLLGDIAADKVFLRNRLVVRDLPLSPAAESFRRLRTNLEFLAVDERPLAVVITSSLAKEGKSTTVANLAIACADVGDRVLLVDADFRQPSIAEYLGIEGSAGLTTVLTGRATFDDVVQPWSTDGRTSLDVLTSGDIPPNPSELLASRAMARFLENVKDRYDIVLFDSAPLLPVTDAAILAAGMTGAVVLAKATKVRRAQFGDAIASIEQVGAKVLGVVLQGVTTKSSNSYYGYAPRVPAGEGRRSASRKVPDTAKSRAAGIHNAAKNDRRSSRPDRGNRADPGATSAPAVLTDRNASTSEK